MENHEHPSASQKMMDYHYKELCPNKTPNIQTYWNISKYQAKAQNIMASRSAVEGRCVLQY